MPSGAVLFASLAVAAWCAALCWHDARTRRLPNRLTLGGTVVALAVRLLWEGPVAGVEGLAAGAAAGALMLLPFLAGGAGGGDVKLMVAAGAVAGWGRLLSFLLLTSVAGVVFGIVLLAAGRMDGARLRHAFRSVLDWRYDRAAGRAALPPTYSETARMPFAIPVSIGLLAALWVAG